MEAFYADHDTIFKTTSNGEKTRGTTQFGRAADELGFKLILVGSPQATGCIERLCETE
jgi:hypothetical protein